MPRLLPVWILLACWALPQPAEAECLTEETFRQAVLDALGTGADKVPPGYRLQASSDRTAEGYEATVRLVDREGKLLGTRKLEARECEALIEEAGLAGALALTNLPTQATLQDTASLPLLDPPEPLPSGRGAVSPDRSLAIQALVTTGGGPGVGGGLSGDLELRFSSFDLRLGLLADLPSRGPVPGGALGVERIVLRASSCLRARAVSFCATVHEGAIRIRGLELVGARTVTRHFTSVGPEFGVNLRLTRRLQLRASIGAQVPFWRIEVRDGEGPSLLWSMPPALVDAGLGLVVGLP